MLEKKCPKCGEISRVIKQNVGNPREAHLNHEAPSWVWVTVCCKAQVGEIHQGYENYIPRIGF